MILMMGEQAAATFTAVSVVLIGAVVQYLLEIHRRRSERRATFLGEQKAVYARFMSAIVTWHAAIRHEHAVRTDVAEHIDRGSAAAVLEEARQAAMSPVFELRLIGSDPVRARGEDVLAFTYDYQDMHAPGGSVPKHPVPRWLDVRDAFIAEVRRDLARVGFVAEHGG